MTLRNRFNLAFLGMFCTALIALVLLFTQANHYAHILGQSRRMAQTVSLVERLQIASIDEALTVQSDPHRLESEEHSTTMESLMATLGRLEDAYISIDASLPPLNTEATARAIRAACDRPDIASKNILAMAQALHGLGTRFQNLAALLDADAAEFALWMIALAGGSCIVVALQFGLFWIFVRRWTIYPIAHLAEGARRLEEGESEYRLSAKRKDEIGELAARLNEMVDRLRERERQLARARELAIVGEICSGVAHGMRNPLAVIRLTAQRITVQSSTSAADQEKLTEIVEQVDRLDARISRLLRFANALEPRFEYVDFGWLSGVVVRECQPSLDEHHVAVRVIDETNGLTCRMDPDLAVQALVECVSNSAHHSRPESTITLRGQSAGGTNGRGPEWVVSVEDRGSGMEPQVLNHIFDLFFTLREKGTGVGLAMVKRIVEQHGGRIEVRSSPGKGTIFEMRWPVVQRNDGRG